MADDNDPQVRWACEASRLEQERLAKRISSRKCCQCNGNGSCTRCDCASKGRKCTNCHPNKKGRCMNQPQQAPVLQPADQSSQVAGEKLPQGHNESETEPVLENSTQTSVLNLSASTVLDDSSRGSEQDDVETTDHTAGQESATTEFLDRKFQRAFGAPLINSDGGPDSDIRSIWWKAVSLRGKQYALSDGNVGTRFVNMLAEEIEKCNAKQQSSEREFIFTAVVLQRDKMVKKSKDIRPLLTRRMDMWEAGLLAELLREAQRCDNQLQSSMSPMSNEQVQRTFNRLMLEGRVRSAVRLVTDRSSGGVLDPADEAHGKTGPLGKTVYDVLQEKHPAPRTPDPSAFLECNELPPLEQVNTTSAHVEQVARRLFGSAGPSGTDSEQWRAFLLRYGNASARMREA
eukprot:scpid50248/ scgid17443/ 